MSKRSSIDRDGFSASRADRTHAALRRHIDSGVLPGLVALIHHRGREHLEVGVFLTQRRPDLLGIPAFVLDFWTSAYQMIDD